MYLSLVKDTQKVKEVCNMYTQSPLLKNIDDQHWAFLKISFILDTQQKMM